MADVPGWARWAPSARADAWTVGMEEEVMLVDAGRWSVANAADAVFAAAPPSLARSMSLETHACVVELRTDPQPTVAAAAVQLAGLRQSLDDLVAGFGLRAAAAGTHPLACGEEVALTTDARYREIAATMRMLARREPTMALHVHVAMPDGDTAVRALDGLRADLPALLALSANSPYWRGADSGFASVRTPVFGMFPRVGIPRRFGSYGEYVRAVDLLLRAEALPEPSFLWWDARLQPRLGTVEVRIMDAQSRIADTVALAALVHCLLCRRALVAARSDAPPEVLAENRFLAARDGIAAGLIDHRSGRRRAARGVVTELLAECESLAPRLGCVAELEGAFALADDPGAARQRRVAQTTGIAAVPAWLAEEFAVEASVAAAV